MLHNSALYVLCIELGRDAGVSLKHFCISRYYCNAFLLGLNLSLHVIRPFWSPGSSYLYLISYFEKHWTPFLWIIFGKETCLKAVICGGFWFILPCITTLLSQSEVLGIFGNKWCPVLLNLCGWRHSKEIQSLPVSQKCKACFVSIFWPLRKSTVFCRSLVPCFVELDFLYANLYCIIPELILC